MMRVAYFGPPDGPARTVAADEAAALDAGVHASESIHGVVEAVERGDAARGVVPLEDERAGPHRGTIDALVFGAATAHVVAVRAVDQDGDQLQLAVLSASAPPRTRAGRSLLFCVPRRNRPGTLTALLAPFGARGLNLTKLESRPLGGRLGEYGFVVEVDAGLAEPALADALEELVADDIVVKVLGAYEPPLSRLGRVTERALPGELLESVEDVARLRERP